MEEKKNIWHLTSTFYSQMEKYTFKQKNLDPTFYYDLQNAFLPTKNILQIIVKSRYFLTKTRAVFTSFSTTRGQRIIRVVVFVLVVVVVATFVWHSHFLEDFFKVNKVPNTDLFSLGMYQSLLSVAYPIRFFLCRGIENICVII